MRLAHVLLLGFVSLCSGLCGGEIKVQSDRWMPLNGTPTEAAPGYAIELLVKIFVDAPKSEDTITYTLEPWADSLDAVAKARAHAVIGAGQDEAPQLVFPQEPIAHMKYGVWVRKEAKTKLSELGLAKVRLGVIRGYSYWQEIDDLVKARADNLTVFSGDQSLSDAVEALNKGEIDALPEAEAVFQWCLKEHKLAFSDFAPLVRHDGGFIYVAFAPSTRGRELAKHWDEGMGLLRKNGELKRILDRYEVPDWSAPTRPEGEK